MKCDERSARHSYKGTIASIVGAAVGAVVSGFSYVLTSGGEIDGVELAKSQCHLARCSRKCSICN